MDGSMKLTYGRGNTIWLRLGLLFIILILVLSCFMLPSTVQPAENGKNINLPYQECIYEVQEQGVSFFFNFLKIFFIF